VGEDGLVTPPSSDAVLSSAVDLARAAVLEIAPADHVGDHVGVTTDTDGLATHTFACLARGYLGWAWAVTVAVVPHGEAATVSEVVLLPGDAAILAPAWVPWTERVRAGDLNPGDLHPTALDDPRLEPGYGGADALEADDETASTVTPLRPEQWELGLGRETVLSPYGRGLAADRWYDGDFGPDSPMAKAAPGQCRGCGFLLPVGGLLGQAFGVCANELGADGRIVALGYGCGAHSSVREIEGTGVPVTEIAVDENVLDILDLGADDDVVLDIPAVVADIVADGSEVVVVTELDVAVLDTDAVGAVLDTDAVDVWRLDTDLVEDLDVVPLGTWERDVAAVEDDSLEEVALGGLRDSDDDDDEDDDGYLVDDDTDDDDTDDEDEADDDGYLSDDDDEDDDEVVEVSPDQIALVLDDVDDIEPDEVL
jgi:hypothetical protein